MPRGAPEQTSSVAFFTSFAEASAESDGQRRGAPAPHIRPHVFLAEVVERFVIMALGELQPFVGRARLFVQVPASGFQRSPHYALIPSEAHHKIEGLLVTTVGGIESYHYRGKQDFGGAEQSERWRVYRTRADERREG